MERLRFLWIALAAGMTSTCLAAQPGWIRYQGRLVENGVLANRPGVQITFYLYDQPAGGTPLYREVDTVTASEGFYATDLGDNPHVSSPNQDFARALATAGTNAWLALQVDAGPELLPRERLGGAPFAVNAGELRRVLTVGPGGEYATIGAALAAIADNSATNGYLVKVGPGVFAERVTLKPFVSLEGCGRGVTTISLVSTNTSGTDYVVLGASNTEIRCMSLAIQGSAAVMYGYSLIGQRPAAISDVAITLTLSGTASGAGIHTENFSSVDLRDLDVTVNGGAATTYGLQFTTGSPGKARNARVAISGAQACTAVSATECSADLEGITVEVNGIGGAATGFLAGQGGIGARDVAMSITATGTVSGFTTGEGSLFLHDVKATLNGNGDCTGVSATRGALTMSDCTVEAAGAADVKGLYLYESDSTLDATRIAVKRGSPNQGADVRNCALVWSGGRLDAAGAVGATNLGVRCANGANLSFHGLAIRLTTGGTLADGLVADNSGSFETNRIEQCIISSPGNAVRSISALSTTFLGGSLLQGGLIRTAGVLRTIRCYDDAHTAIADGDH